MSYTVIITEEVAANVEVTTQNYPITIEYNATNIADGTTYGNSNVSNYLASGTDTANIITTGNVQGAYVIGNGSALSNITGANVTGTVANATYATSSGTASYVTANAQANITSVGTLSSLSVSGNVTGGTFLGSGAVPTGGDADTYLVKNSATNYDYAWTDRVNAKTIYENVKNISGGSLPKGTPVYQAGVTGNTITVGVARADDPTKLAVGVLDVTLADQAEGRMLVLGEIKGVNTAGFTTGDEIYLGATGGYTNVKPTSSSVAIQFLGVVNRINASNGSGFITGTLTPDAVKYATYAQVWTGTAWVPATELSSDTTPALGGDLAGGAYNIATTGNITGGNIIGNGQYLSSLTAANVSGTVANAAYATTAGSATTAGTANIALVANSVAGANVSGAVAQATQADTANVALVANSVAGANVSGTVANATYADSAGTSVTVTGAAQGNITSVGTLTTLSVSGNVQGANINTNGIVSAASNVLGLNLIAAGNLTSTQQSVIGTANVGTTGNIVMSGKNIATDMAFVPDGGNAVTADTSRVVVGTGWNGNISHSAQQQRLLVSDTYNRTNTATQVRLLASEALVNLTANVTNSSTRNQALGGSLRIGGGASANTQLLTMGAGAIFGVAGGQFNIDVGNISPYNLGNTTISHATLNGGALQIQAGSTVLNAYGINNLISFPITGSPGNVGNIIGYSTSMPLTTVPAGNVYAFYHGNASTGTVTGVPVTNAIRQAPQYYAFYNADEHAQVQLGSLKSYNEFRYDTATSGTVNISKTNGQVQYIRPTGNITIGDLQNFVSETTDASTYDQQIDTVTIVIAQGATPYSITMPTGNAAIKYAGNVSTVGATANAVSMISISAANIASVKTYMVTISPEFV